MGTKPSSIQEEDERQHDIINHPRFSKVRLLSGENGKYLQIAQPVVNEAEIKNWEKDYKSLKEHECLMLPLSHEFEGTQMCGSNGICRINYQNFPFLLKDQINDRVEQSHDPFLPQELWYMGYSLFEAASIFHKQGKKIGDVQPGNIFIDENGRTKVGTQYSWPQQSTNYQKTVFQKEITYLAPEEIKDLHFGHTDSRSNNEISESFSIGLTLLDSALLTNSKDLYNLANYRFNYQLLEERIKNMKARNDLDEVLKLTIAGLCRPQPAERLKCTEIFAWLKQYEEFIVNTEPFTVETIPDFLKQANQEKSVLKANIRPVSSQPIYTESLVSEIPQRFYAEPIFLPAPRPVQTIEYRPIAETTFRPQPQAFRHPVEYTRQPAVQIQRPIQNFQTEVPKSYVVTSYQESNNGSFLGPANLGPIPTINASDDFRLTLQKIEQQLALSRKMFPS